MTATPSRDFLLHGKVQDQHPAPLVGFQDPLTFATCGSGSAVTSPHWKGGMLIPVPTPASPALRVGMSCRGALCQNHDSGGDLGTLSQMLDLARAWPLSSRPGKKTGQAGPAHGGSKDQRLQQPSCWAGDTCPALSHFLTPPWDGRAWGPPTTVTHADLEDNPSTDSMPAPAPCSPSAVVFSAKPNQAINDLLPELPTSICSTPNISLQLSSNQLQTQQCHIQLPSSSCLPGASLAPQGELPQCWQPQKQPEEEACHHLPSAFKHPQPTNGHGDCSRNLPCSHPKAPLRRRKESRQSHLPSPGCADMDEGQKDRLWGYPNIPHSP